MLHVDILIMQNCVLIYCLGEPEGTAEADEERSGDEPTLSSIRLEFRQSKFLIEVLIKIRLLKLNLICNFVL